MTARSTQSLYASVAESLRSAVFSGQWRPGERIPPELELCDRYHVSRITVRRAIQILVDEKLLERRRPTGTFVRPWDVEEHPDDHFTLSTNLSAQMRELGEEPRTIWARISIEVPNGRVARILGAGAGEEVMVLRRARGDESRPYGYFVSWFTPVEGMPTDDGSYLGSFYELLAGHGVAVDRAKDCVEAIRPPAEVQDALRVPASWPVLKRTRIASQSRGAYREVSECFYRGESYRYYIDFSENGAAVEQ